MAATDMYVTTTGAGTKSGLSWANAFSLTELETDMEASAEVGDRYFIKEGTYTFASDISTALDGSVSANIHLIGVTSATTAEPPTSSDWATGNNRPLFSQGTYLFVVDDSWSLHHMRFLGSAAIVVNMGDRCIVNNIYVENNSSTAGREAIILGFYGTLFNSEFISTNGHAIDPASAHINGCYIHDSVRGIDGGDIIIVHSIIDTCSGEGIVTGTSMAILNCTIYNCGTGILGSQFQYGISILNTVIDNCTDGFKSHNFGTVYSNWFIDYNNWSNNTHDMSWDNGASEDNSAKGPNDTANAPSFANAAAGDFSLGDTSNLIDAGFSISLGTS